MQLMTILTLLQTLLIRDESKLCLRWHRCGLIMNPPRLKTRSTGAEDAGTANSFMASMWIWGKRSWCLAQKWRAFSMSVSSIVSKYFATCVATDVCCPVLRFLRDLYLDSMRPHFFGGESSSSSNVASKSSYSPPYLSAHFSTSATSVSVRHEGMSTSYQMICRLEIMITLLC